MEKSIQRVNTFGKIMLKDLVAGGMELGIFRGNTINSVDYFQFGEFALMETSFTRGSILLGRGKPPRHAIRMPPLLAEGGKPPRHAIACHPSLRKEGKIRSSCFNQINYNLLLA